MVLFQPNYLQVTPDAFMQEFGYGLALAYKKTFFKFICNIFSFPFYIFIHKITKYISN